MVVFTMASREFVSILHNFMSHMASALPQLPYEVHASDSTTLEACIDYAQPTATCVSSPLSPSGDHQEWKDYYANPFFRHKVQILVRVLARARSEVIMLDVTALVTNYTCFFEWQSSTEDIVTSAGNVSPPFFAQQFGLVANTGATLVRFTALSLWQEVLNEMRREVELNGQNGSVSEQVHLGWVLMKHNFTWIQKHETSGVASIWAHKRRLLIRFLDTVRWPRSCKRRDGRCLYHPYVHTNRSSRFTSDGFWYL